jgi:hypothetical protein
MQLAYGGILFPVNAAKVTRSSSVLAPAGIPIVREWQYDVEIVLTPDNVGVPNGTASQLQFAFSIVTEQILSALAVYNQPLTFYTDTGAIAMQLSPAGSLSGVSVVTMNNPEGDGSEFAGKRTIAFTAKASYPIGNINQVLVKFTETIERIGTGQPAKLEVPAMGNYGFRIYPRGVGVARAVQSGEAVGALQAPYWIVPKPLWPLDEDLDQRVMTDGSPERVGETLMNFPLTWRYSFSRIRTPFLGTPKRWR